MLAIFGIGFVELLIVLGIVGLILVPLIALIVVAFVVLSRSSKPPEDPKS